ncbi:hypothetical protein Hdeb2414_s0007g00249981 [Helianthus debilis subsp. tardiflorus]
MGEDTMEFEAARKEFVTEREAFNDDKKGLLWMVADSEEKLAKEKQYNADRQKEWEQACERTNRELKAALDEVVRLKGEKAEESDEYERVVALYQKRESEYERRLADLEKVVAKKTAESKASKILAEEINNKCKWLLACGVPLGCSLVIPFFLYDFSFVVHSFSWPLQIADRIVKSDELAKYMFELGETTYNSGCKDGYGEGRAAAAANEKDCTAAYAAKRQEYEFLEFAIVRAVEKLSRKGGAVETLKKALGDQDVETAGAGSNHQV